MGDDTEECYHGPLSPSLRSTSQPVIVTQGLQMVLRTSAVFFMGIILALGKGSSAFISRRAAVRLPSLHTTAARSASRQQQRLTVTSGMGGATPQSYDGVRIGPPPDLPSLLLHNRIVYIGMPLVPAVTELIIAELLYLNYESADKVRTLLSCLGRTSGLGSTQFLQFEIPVPHCRDELCILLKCAPSTLLPPVVRAACVYVYQLIGDDERPGPVGGLRNRGIRGR